jgi:hypothetical protein
MIKAQTTCLPAEVNISKTWLHVAKLESNAAKVGSSAAKLE